MKAFFRKRQIPGSEEFSVLQNDAMNEDHLRVQAPKFLDFSHKIV